MPLGSDLSTRQYAWSSQCTRPSFRNVGRLARKAMRQGSIQMDAAHGTCNTVPATRYLQHGTCNMVPANVYLCWSEPLVGTRTSIWPKFIERQLFAIIARVAFDQVIQG